MSSFILKILFSGMIVFSPNQNGTEVTVLLLNAGHTHHLSDGSALQDHKPLLIARAGNCTGDCPTRDADIAQFVYEDQSASVALDSLESAVAGGGAWTLNGSDISIVKASSDDPDLPALSIERNARSTSSIIPSTSGEREDYSWVSDLHQLCSTCTVDSNIFASQPPDTIAARLHLRNGRLSTYSIGRMGPNVTPVQFKRLDGTGSASSYSQAIATWVEADIEVSGSGIEITEDKFNGDPGRTMTLTPDANNTVEIAVLNLPPFVPPASANNEAPQVGKHFEKYYDLFTNPPSQADRLVPFAGAASGAPSYPEVTWTSIHPTTTLGSNLLNALRLDVGRGPYNRLICPPGDI
ncbi:MAG TPA: hypothetical protein VGR95_12005 [Thermoanaerobaculia bacterium]|jgi:hypothetical protein|nr:hypothetical protein [Thermoanaerobaculia bacterium]